MEGQNITEWTVEEIKKPKFVAGQIAYYFDGHAQPMDCLVQGYHGEEIFITTRECGPIGWFTEETLFLNLSEAYASVSRGHYQPEIKISGSDPNVLFKRHVDRDGLGRINFR